MTDTIFDTHAHYDHKQYDKDRDTVVGALPAEGVGRVVNVGCDMKSSRASVVLAEKFPFVYATVGVHPHDAKTLTEEKMAELVALAKNEKVVAFGEIGLDFNRNFSPPDVQRHWFARQLAVAHSLHLPVVIHSRDADDEVYEMLAASYSGSVPTAVGPTRRGVIHAFPGDVALARRYVALGFCLGIGGVLTYDKTGRLEAVVGALPLEHLVLETDCPYLTPVPWRGKRNRSSYLSSVVTKVARIKGISEKEVRTKTCQNAYTLFGIDTGGTK